MTPLPFFLKTAPHIHKSYLLQPTEQQGATPPDSDLLALFAVADADGDGQITQREALEYIRSSEGIDLDEHSIALMWEVADSDGDGTIDIAEFPKLLEAIRRVAAKQAGAKQSMKAPPSTTGGQRLGDDSVEGETVENPLSTG